MWRNASEPSYAIGPRGAVTRTLRDALGRTTVTIEDFTGNGTPTSASNKTTLYGYNSAGMTSLTAVNPGSATQTTGWAYGVTTATGSTINTNDIVGATEPPDPTTGNASTSQEDAVTADAQGRRDSLMSKLRGGNGCPPFNCETEVGTARENELG